MGAFVMIVCVVMLGLCSPPCLASGVWSQHPQDQTVDEGRSVSFTCVTTVNTQVQCPGGPSYIYWMYKSKTSALKPYSFCSSLYSGVPARVSVSLESNSHVSRLYISNVTSSDEGRYFCKSLGGGGQHEVSEEALLTVNISEPATTPTPTCQPQNDINPQCSFRHVNPKEDQEILLSCRQPEGGQTTLSWSSSNNGTLVSSREEQTTTQGNFHNVTHVLRKSDNCERFTCRAEGNCGVLQCEVGPFKFPVFVSPQEMKVVESGGPDIFTCNTDALPSTCTYKWFVRSKDQPPQAVDDKETDQFELLEAGKSLRVNALSVADNGTEVKCEVEYQSNCSQSSPWAVLLISTQGSGAPSSAIAVAAHSSMGLMVWCFVIAGVGLVLTAIPHVF
ncbi:uncharacterized protein [Asterias amurensis]|uniref:uncharacterized protein n=1 Tax=Asterias amurensis TaxID=7602 RepID=UPI003AB5B824